MHAWHPVKALLLLLLAAVTRVRNTHMHTCRDKLRGLPLAPGCVSLYIRHGDKHTEHQTYNDSEYESALEHLRQVDPSLTRQVFLSTEDPATVVYFTNATRNWSTTYVDMPRKPDRSGAVQGVVLGCVPQGNDPGAVFSSYTLWPGVPTQMTCGCCVLQLEVLLLTWPLSCCSTATAAAAAAHTDPLAPPSLPTTPHITTALQEEEQHCVHERARLCRGDAGRPAQPGPGPDLRRLCEQHKLKLGAPDRRAAVDGALQGAGQVHGRGEAQPKGLVLLVLMPEGVGLSVYVSLWTVRVVAVCFVNSPHSL